MNFLQALRSVTILSLLLTRTRASASDHIIDVSGTRFQVEAELFSSQLCDKSMLSSMFSGRFPYKTTEVGIFLDADPESFGHILTFLRSQRLPKILPWQRDLLRNEAERLGLDHLLVEIDLLDPLRRQLGQSLSVTPYLRLVDALIANGRTSEAMTCLRTCLHLVCHRIESRRECQEHYRGERLSPWHHFMGSLVLSKTSLLEEHPLPESLHDESSLKLLSTWAEAFGHWRFAADLLRQGNESGLLPKCPRFVRILRLAGLHKQALEAALELVQAEPLSGEALKELGLSQRDNGQLKLAIDNLIEAAQSLPCDQQLNLEIGKLASWLQTPSTALWAWERALSHDPSNVVLQVALAESLNQLGRYRETICFLAPASNVIQDLRLVIPLTEAYEKRGGKEEAVMLLHRALRRCAFSASESLKGRARQRLRRLNQR